jgi:hypothetical protein
MMRIDRSSVVLKATQRAAIRRLATGCEIGNVP